MEQHSLVNTISYHQKIHLFVIKPRYCNIKQHNYTVVMVAQLIAFIR